MQKERNGQTSGRRNTKSGSPDTRAAFFQTEADKGRLPDPANSTDLMRNRPSRKPAARTGKVAAKTVVKRGAKKPVAKTASKSARKATQKPKKSATKPINDTGVTPMQPPIETQQIERAKDVAPAGALTAPLPRAAAVTPWRKTGPFDAIGYWMRKSARSIIALFKSDAKKPMSEAERLRAENAKLREQLQQLLDRRAAP